MTKWFETIEARWQAWWPELEQREQRIILAAAALVMLALLWWVALAPALRTLSSAPAEHARLEAQLQRMAQLQAQAKALQSQPRASREDAMRSLETSVRQGLGPNAQIQPAGSGENVTIAMRSTPAESLAQWFAKARSNARALPREVHLTRSAQNQAQANGRAAPKEAEPAGVRWDGTLIMSLPAR